MSNKNKKIKFQYFAPCCIDSENGKEFIFDLLEWVRVMLTKSEKEKISDVNGVIGRCENIVQADTVTYYAFNFMRLDTNSNTYIVKENEEAKHIDLDDDEYIGKNTVVLYDSVSHILMIQSNRGGYSASSIETYINYFLETKKCFLRPILDNFDNGNHRKIKKLEVRFANIKGYKEKSTRRSFENIINQCDKLHGCSAKIEITIDRKNIDQLDNETIRDSIKDLKESKDNLSTAKVYVCDDIDDKKSAVFDLFDNIAHDYKNFSVPERGELGFEYLYQEMKNLYSTKRGKLVALLEGQKE